VIGEAAFAIDLADFGAFYELTYDGAYRTALGILRDPGLAADVTQDAYVSAYRKRDHFRGDAPGYAWLHAIVVNHALGALRKRRPTVTELEVVDASRSADVARTASDRLTLLTALDQLRPQQRAAVVLRYYHDYDYATIARILGTTTTNVGALLSRALDSLREQLEPPQAVARGQVAR
jgi:RNA polymerase sigma-70 factor, ECF subfamily